MPPNPPDEDGFKPSAETLYVPNLRTTRSGDVDRTSFPQASSPVVSMGAAIHAAATGKLGDGKTYITEGGAKLRKLLVIFLGSDIDLHQVSVDLAFFDNLVGVGRFGIHPSPYVSADSFKKDRARARVIIRRYHVYLGFSETVASPLLGNHEECLLAFQTAHRAGEIDLGNRFQKLISVKKVLQIAAVEDRPVHELTRHWFTVTLEASSKNADRVALRACAKLFDRARVVASLALLLPPNTISPLPTQPSIRNDSSPIPLRLRTEIDTLLTDRQLSGDPPEITRRLGLMRSDVTIRGERTGLNWYVQILQVLNLIGSSNTVGLVHLARRDWLERAAKAEVRGEVPWRPIAARTLFDYVSSVERCLTPFEPELRGCATQLRRENEFFRGINKMTQKNQAACLSFVRSPDLQKRYFAMPATFFVLAKAGFEKWPAATRKERRETLHYAIVAAASSILTAVPLRRRSLLELAPFGSRANLRFLPGVVEINLDPNQVKNRQPIRREILDRPTHSPVEILEWFVGEPRQALLDSMPGTPDPDRLFGGMNANRLTRIWQSILSRHGFFINVHFIRHLLATWFLHNDHKSLPMAAASLTIREDTASRFYAFVHRESLARKSDAFLDNVLGLLFPSNDDAETAPSVPSSPKPPGLPQPSETPVCP